MEQVVREIWFRCTQCSQESYCSAEFERRPNAEVMCPFCHHMMKLTDVRLD